MTLYAFDGTWNSATLDDNVEPHLYGPLTAYLLDRARI